MRDAARLTDLRALDDARAGFVKFRDEAGQALMEVEIEAQRALNWVRTEQDAYWKQQHRVRGERLEQARSELRRAQFPASDGRIPSAIEQKKAVAKAEAAVEEARQKIESVRRWSRLLERELAEYSGLAQPLAGALDADLPRAIALLDRMLHSVEGYLAVAPVEGDEETSTGDNDASMARPTTEPAPVRFRVPLTRDDRALLRARLLEMGVRAPEEVRLLPASAEASPRIGEEAPDLLAEANIDRRPVDPNDRVVIEPGALSDGESIALLRLDSEEDGTANRPAWAIGSLKKVIPAGEPLVVPVFRLLQDRRDLRPIMDFADGSLIVVTRRGLALMYDGRDALLVNAMERER